jgi:hypothetical protein
VAKNQALVKHNGHKENKHKRHDDLSRGSAKYNTCLLHVVASQWTRVALKPLSSDPMINLNTMVVFFLILFLVCEESPQLGVSRPYNKDQSESTRVREGRSTHKSAAVCTHTEPRLELE